MQGPDQSPSQRQPDDELAGRALERGVASWSWANDFQKVLRVVRIRWNAERFPETHDSKGDITLAGVPASVLKIPTVKRTGYFAAFVLDARGRWSGPTPDSVHRFALGVARK